MYYILFLICLTIAGKELKAQDPLLVMQQTVPLYVNPALAGDEYYTRVALNYRNHYPAVGNAFVTYTGTVDYYYDRVNSGLGLMFMADQLGSTNFGYTSVSFAYSYKLSLSEDKSLRFGLAPNLYYGYRNTNGLVFPDMINTDGTFLPNDVPYDNENKMGFDFSTGVVYNSKDFLLGASVFHLGSPNDSIYWNRPLRFFAHGELRIPLLASRSYVPQSNLKNIVRRTEIRPNVYFFHQGKVTMLGTGAFLQVSNFNLGLFSRQTLNFKTVTFSAQVGYISDLLEIHYAMDVGRLSNNFQGIPASSHEISLVIKFFTGKED